MRFEGLCKVYAAGNASDAGVGIQLTDPEGGAFAPMWFTPVPGKERECLAVGIAAISSKRKVLAVIPEVDNWKPLGELYLVDTPSE